MIQKKVLQKELVTGSAHSTSQVVAETRKTIKIGLPIVAAQLVQMSMSFVDTIMAGHFGARDLAAIAAGGSLYGPFMFMTVGVMLAINPIVAQLHGAGKIRPIGQNLWQVLWLSQILAVPCIFVFRNMETVMGWFKMQPEIIPVAQGYLDAFSWGFPAALGFFALRYFNEGVAITKPSVVIALIGLGFNIIGNYVFMFGHLGLPAMGAVGTGWATTLVWWISFLAMALYTFRSSNSNRFQIRSGIRRPVWHFQKEILRIGLPNGISLGIEVTMFAIAALIIGSLGVNELAAHQMTINFAAFTFMIPLGLSIATTSRVGFAVGQEKLHLSRIIGYIGIGLSVFVMSITAAVMMVFPEIIIKMYTQDFAVAAIATKLLFLAGVFQISDGLQVSAMGALRGLKDTKIPMIVNVLAYWVVGLPTGYFLGIVKGFGAEGLWVGLIFGLTVAAILHNWRFYRLTS